MSGWITIEMSGGTAIEAASADAQRVADLLGISVEFEFNGVKCFASPGGDAALLAQRQQDQQARPQTSPHDRAKFASSRP